MLAVSVGAGVLIFFSSMSFLFSVFLSQEDGPILTEIRPYTA